VSAIALARLTVRSRRRRILALVAFACLFLAAALTGRFLATGPEGNVQVGELFVVGGYPLVSALLLLGWVLGRFPLIATLVLLAGLVSDDRRDGYLRVYGARPVSLVRIYGARWLALAGVAFLLSIVLMPLFDLIMLGKVAGLAYVPLILAYTVAYGGLTALLSVWTRGDAWIALMVAVFALVWNALLDTGALAGTPPGITAVITFLAPPQSQLLRLEGAFASIQPIPWDAFLLVCAYGVVALVLAGVSLANREI
jgi:ABC-type transport system involved in multi-copper enzyme maturation permease subunit